MTRKYTRQFKVRSYECDAFEHLNNAVYLHYMQEAALEASADAGYDMQAYNRLGQFWLIRETDIEYLRPLYYEDTVRVHTWVEDFRRVRSRRRYVFERGDEVVANGSTDWMFLDRQSFRPAPIPEAMIRAFDPELSETRNASRSSFPEAPAAPAGVHTMNRIVEWRDIDSVGHVNNAVYVNYIEEAGIDVARANGWSMQRMIDKGFGILARRHQIEYRQQARMGEDLQIDTWLSPWQHTSANRHYIIRRRSDGETIVRAHTRWVWFDLKTGRPIRIPQNFAADFVANIASSEA